MTETREIVRPTVHQYEAAFNPVTPLTPAQLFEFQVQAWLETGLVKREDIEPLRNLVPQDGKFFIPVPPKPKLERKENLDKLVEVLTHNGNPGVNYLDPKYLADEVETPTSAYLLTEVDDGRAMLNISPRDAKVRLMEMGRSPLTWWEVFALYVPFREFILGHHNVDCSGSRCGSGDVPRFYLRDDRLKFDGGWGGGSGPGWGSASWGSRNGLWG